MNNLVFAQPKKASADSIPDLSFAPDTTFAPAKKKKKEKKNVFYGLKCRKGYTREGVGEKQIVQLFYVLRKNQPPSDYIDEIYVWDLTKAKVVAVKKDELATMKNYRILHGPYAKYQDGKHIETGIFYIGTKHGRWERYRWEKIWWNTENQEEVLSAKSKQDMIPILIDKVRYYKGLPREAQVSYYDFERKKIREVIPYVYGQKTGTYLYFSETGQLLIKGNYADGKKVGIWVEYFKDKNRKMRETQYPKDQYTEQEPIILKEWDERGNLIILNGKKVDTNTKKEDPIKKTLKRNK
ncbi:MAG: hypothetical protein NZ529_05835 [Cytophagaceae bacterium]|nr:hypothetical protein [Cytophagaceae bacterium]MDW8456298.1 hypothetical protein [Cytophagaceae bacterium]